jgi:hypothetical protein
MEIFGGFMVMMSILGFFLAVLWFILPFVIFAMKGKLDRACELLENMDRRLAVLEGQLNVSGLGREEPAARTNGPNTPPSVMPPVSAGE